MAVPLPLTVWVTTNCEKFFKKCKYQTTLPASQETCMQVKEQQLKPNKKKQNDSKMGKECIKFVYCHRNY